MIKREIVQVENISVEELTEIIAEKLVDKLETRIATLYKEGKLIDINVKNELQKLREQDGNKD